MFKLIFTFHFILFGQVAWCVQSVQMDSKLLKSLPVLSGSVSWDQPKARYYVLDFWASWCGPCEETFPFYEKLLKSQDSRDFVWIGISEDADPQNAKKFLSRHPSTIVHLHDVDQKLAQRLEITSLPRLLIFDSKFELVWSQRGFSSKKGQAILNQIQTLSQKR